MGGFDIYVSTSPGYLVPTGAALGSLIVIPFATVICINDSAQPGSDPCGVQTANGPGVVQVSTVEMSGSNECSGMTTCSGMAFTISYKVVAAIARTSIFLSNRHGMQHQQCRHTCKRLCPGSRCNWAYSAREHPRSDCNTEPHPFSADIRVLVWANNAAGRVRRHVCCSSEWRNSALHVWMDFRGQRNRIWVRINHTYSSAGSYTITLSVNDSGLPAQAVSSQQLITVASPPLPDFSITVNPSYVAFQVGGTGSFTATVSQQNGFTGTVSLSVTTSPSNGLIVSCHPTSLPGATGPQRAP